jgi:hypothetical protein
MMKTFILMVSMLFSVTSAVAQTNYYTTSKTFYETGYTYQCDHDGGVGIILYNKNNRLTYVDQLYNDTGENYVMPEGVDVLEYETWTDPKADSIVRNAFSMVERQRLKGYRFNINMRINPNTGKVDEVDFWFMASTPYTTIPISVYRKIEVDIKKYLWFVPTEEGKKINYIYRWLFIRL